MSESAISAPLGEMLARHMPTVLFGDDAAKQELRDALVRAKEGVVLQGRQAYAVYADVLGFRAALDIDAEALERRLETALIQTNFAMLVRIPGALTTKPDGTVVKGPVVGLDRLNPAAIFSDSIFVVSHDESRESLRQTCHIANTMWVHFFHQGLPLRGAIAKGRVWWNRNTDVRLGPGIGRAYELAERIAGIGMAVDDEIEAVENVGPPVAFRWKVDRKTVEPRALRVPLQLQRNSLPMAYSETLGRAFREFAKRPENQATTELRARYEGSFPAVDALSAPPVSA